MTTLQIREMHTNTKYWVLLLYLIQRWSKNAIRIASPNYYCKEMFVNRLKRK